MKIHFIFLLLHFTALAYAQREELSVPGQNLFANKIFVAQQHFPNLNGEGITVSIKELRFDTNDVDLKGRILFSPQVAPASSIHANIMASLVGGAGNADLQGLGAAPGCQLVSSSFVGLQPDLDYANPRILVQNHSYGIDIQNYYGSGAAAYDQSTLENPGLLHVFSAGNKGDSAALSGIYANIPGFANLSGNFKMAKNVLTVGAIDSFGQLVPISSSGPAYDGRIKPELMAFGYDGTSGAAALVSGSAAILQQALWPYFNGAPGTALLRAIFINSADDLATPGPDFETGFGSLDLLAAVNTVKQAQFLFDSIQSGQTISIPIQIPDKIRQFKLSLAWNDPVAPLFSAKSLIHDLDLSLLDPLGQEQFPWVLNVFPDKDSLQQPARKGLDSLNNLEQITLDSPEAGMWEIRVKAPNTLKGPQAFALAWSMDTLQHFLWHYPFTQAPCPAGESVILQWEHNFSDTIAQLEWRSLADPVWRTITDSVRLQLGWQRWIVPDTFTEAQLRMRIGSQIFESDTFLISRALRLNIGFNCPDSVLLFWNKPAENIEYQLYGLGTKFMEPIARIADTFVVLQKLAFPQARFAVAPMMPSLVLPGTRSIAPDIDQQGIGCYFRNFLAELNEDQEVDLSLQIGAIYGLKSIYFEKKIKGQFEVLDEQLAQQLDFDFSDAFPQTGANTYRPRLLLMNGQVLIGDTITVYKGGPNGYWIYPNPAVNQGFVQVISATDGEASFHLFDVMGKQVLQQLLEEVNVPIALSGLPKGIYFFRINDGEEYLGEGKLLIE